MLPSCKRFKADTITGGIKQLEDSMKPEEQLEDDQIQCSMPYYLDHMFGQCMRDKVISPLPQACIPPPSTPILDSQGFLATKATDRLKIDRESSPLMGIHLSSVPQAREEMADQPSSPPLFASPDHSDKETAPPKTDASSNTITVPESQLEPASVKDSNKIDIDSTRNVLSTAVVKEELLQIKRAQNSKSTERRGRGRKRKLPFGSEVEEYCCPLNATTLKDCSLTEKQVIVSVLAMVLQVNPVMDVHCKVGGSAGQTVPMSSLLLADPTKSYFKLSLWRQAAVWVERISAGDVIYFRRIRLKKWRREVVGTTTMYSSVLNLHQPKKDLPSQVTSEIPKESLGHLLQWGKKRFGYLFQESMPKSQRIVEFVSSEDLSSHSIIHFRGKLISLVTNKVLVLADSPERDVYLYLVGVDTTLWCPQLHSNVGKVIEVTYLATSPDSLTQGGCTLHTTSRSQLRSLATDCQISTDILKLFPAEGSLTTGLVTSGHSIAQVLTNKSTGVYQFKASAVRIGLAYETESCLERLCEHFTPPLLVEEMCQNHIYVGCGGCSKPLVQDENGIYAQCRSCLLMDPRDQRPSFQHYFRLLSVTLRDESGAGVVMVTHTVSPKILGVDPVDIVRVRLSKDNEKFSKMKDSLCARLSCLSKCEEGVWTVSLGVSKDENSFVQSITTSLLDWSCDNHVIT